MKNKIKTISLTLGLSVVIAFTAFNFSIVQTYQDGAIATKLTLTELAAKAQSGGEVDCDCQIFFGNDCKANGWGRSCWTESEACWRGKCD